MNGIYMNVMVLYAHAQNRLAKHCIHTIVKRIRLLAESRLSKFLWAEAAASQIIVRNLI